jgi:hypothetical protein
VVTSISETAWRLSVQSLGSQEMARVTQEEVLLGRNGKDTAHINKYGVRTAPAFQSAVRSSDHAASLVLPC